MAWQALAERRPHALRDPERVARRVEELLRVAPELLRLRADGNTDFLRGVVMASNEVDHLDHARIPESLPRRIAALEPLLEEVGRWVARQGRI